MENNVTVLSKATLNEMVEANPSREDIAKIDDYMNKGERACGVIRAKLLITAKKCLINDDFVEYYKASGYEKTYVSKIVKAENVIRLIEIWNGYPVEEFSINQLIEFARIDEVRFTDLLMDNEINPSLTIAEIRKLAKELNEGESDSEADSEAEGESDSENVIDMNGTITITVKELYRMLDMTNIVDIKETLGAYLHK